MRFKVPGGSKEFVSGSKYQEALRSLYQVQSAPCIALSPTRTTVHLIWILNYWINLS